MEPGTQREQVGAAGAKHGANLRRACLFGLVLAVSCPQLGHASYDELTEDEVYCEEAVALVQVCCAQLPTLSCDYRAPSGCSCDGECSDPGQRPAIDGSDYECLERLSCDAIVLHGFCAEPWKAGSLAPPCGEAL